MSDDLYPELTEDEQETAETEKRMNRLYRNVFSGTEGNEVLADILLHFCHYFSFIEPEEQGKIAQRNVGLAILERMNLIGPYAKDFIKLILSVEIKGEET